MSVLTISVSATERALEYRRGALHQVLSPGRHRRAWRAEYVHVDLRASLLPLSPQEVLTADGLSVRVSATVRWAVVDPQAYHERSLDPIDQIYLATQVALREALSGLTVEELTRRGARLPTDELREAADAVARELGTQVLEVVVKDVLLPPEVRAAATELATARARGAAQLEAARSETAALRSLANAGKLLDAHPALAQLRLVQSAPPGARLVVQVGAVGPVCEQSDLD